MICLLGACFACRRRRSRIKALLHLALLGVTAWMSPAIAQSNIQNQGGPIMQTATVYLIFWLPPGFQFDPSVPNGIGNYETLLTDFFNDVAPSTYYSIVGQYTGTCGSNACIVQNSPNAVRVGGTFLDTRGYAHANGDAAAGTEADPLLDADIQHEVQSLISQYGLSDGVNTEFFVYVGSGVHACFHDPSTHPGTPCTFPHPGFPRNLCGFHSNFTDSNGNDVVYSFMPAVDGLANCNEGVTTSPNGQISSDREVVATSHEFFESVSDPLPFRLQAWISSGAMGGEIGDNCSFDVGVTQPDGSNVTLNGARFVVQRIWSNFTSSCSLGLPSIELQIATGGDDLRDNSSVTVSALSNTQSILQTFDLKPQNQPGFGNYTIYRQMFGFATTSTPQVGAVSITLTSHPDFLQTNDNWNIQGVVGEIFDATGSLFCQFQGNGSPLMRLTGDLPTGVIAAPNCAPPPICQQTLCGSVCTNLNTDPHNCGSCANDCTTTSQQCLSGQCLCAAGTQRCTPTGCDLGCRAPWACPTKCIPP